MSLICHQWGAAIFTWMSCTVSLAMNPTAYHLQMHKMKWFWPFSLECHVQCPLPWIPLHIISRCTRWNDFGHFHLNVMYSVPCHESHCISSPDAQDEMILAIFTWMSCTVSLAMNPTAYHLQMHKMKWFWPFSLECHVQCPLPWIPLHIISRCTRWNDFGHFHLNVMYSVPCHESYCISSPDAQDEMILAIFTWMSCTVSLAMNPTAYHLQMHKMKWFWPFLLECHVQCPLPWIPLHIISRCTRWNDFGIVFVPQQMQSHKELSPVSSCNAQWTLNNYCTTSQHLTIIELSV